MRRDGNREIATLLEMDKSSLPADGGSDFNRLVFQQSPYLLQHARNPVDWYPWGEEAFRAARMEDKPLFLSIGYATCHWCHVMAHESFEDQAVAATLNRYFIPVKVDREERPDIDDRYMLAAQMMTGGGGWPLNVFLTPEGKPFYAMTYVPRERRYGMPGIIELLERVAEFWRRDRERLERDSDAVADGLRRFAHSGRGGEPSEDVGLEGFRQLSEIYDATYGGFGTAPKFPMPHYLSFLMRCAHDGLAGASDMALNTLRQLRNGGIFDQIGYGFHRYSVDRHWLVSHFEKMLYDQALLVQAYLDAWLLSREPLFLRTAEETIEFVLREMTSPDGGFYSALDADSEGEEGKFYVWTPDEVAAVLGDDASLFCELFDVTPRGNFEGKNVLHLKMSVSDLAKLEGIPLHELEAKVAIWREALLAERERRVRPLRDEKIIAAWNGLMTAACARAAAITGNARYLDAAIRAATFAETRLRNDDGRLLRSFHRGPSAVTGFLDDYAAHLWGLIELHQATLDPHWLERAARTASEMLHLFRGGEGPLLDSPHDGEPVLVNLSGSYDGVIPSSNSIAAMQLLRLGRVAGIPELEEAGAAIVRGLWGAVQREPVNHLHLLSAGLDLLSGGTVVTLEGDPDDESVREMLAAVRQTFAPALTVTVRESDAAAAHVCTGRRCLAPVRTARELVAQLS